MTKETAVLNTTDAGFSRILNRVAEFPITDFSAFTQQIEMLIKHHGLFSPESLLLVSENILRFVGDLNSRQAVIENIKRNNDTYLDMELNVRRALGAGFAAGSVIRNLVGTAVDDDSYDAGLLEVAYEAERAAADLMQAYKQEHRGKSMEKAA